MTDDLNTTLNTKRLPRRQFLKIAGGGALVALAGAGCSLTDKAEAACPYNVINDPYPGQCRRYIDRNGDGYCDRSAASTTIAQPTAELQTGESSNDQSTPGVSSSLPAGPTTRERRDSRGESGQCNRRCSYPGHCNRYSDSNGTGICDRSEA